MANLTGNYTDSNGYTSAISDKGGVLAVSPTNAPWTASSFGAWGYDSANQDAGNSRAGVIVFVYSNGKTDTETFLYDPDSKTLTFANKQVWTPKS